MDETYETTGLTYITTIDYSETYSELGIVPNTKDIVFISEYFYFTARTLNNIIQYAAGQRITEPLSNGLYPTLEEFQVRNRDAEMFNVNPQPLQTWIDNLTI